MIRKKSRTLMILVVLILQILIPIITEVLDLKTSVKSIAATERRL